MIIRWIESFIGRFLTRMGLNIRAKLILIFAFIIVIPLVLITFVAINQFHFLGTELQGSLGTMKTEANIALETMGSVAVTDSV